MDESPFPPAGEPIPPEAEAVARDAVRPQGQLRGERQPPQPIPESGFGLASPIELPRASHELERGRPVQAVIGLSSPHESADSARVATFSALRSKKKEEKEEKKSRRRGPLPATGGAFGVAPRERRGASRTRRERKIAPPSAAGRPSAALGDARRRVGGALAALWRRVAARHV